MKHLLPSLFFIFALLFSFLFLLPKVNQALATTVTLTATADTMISSYSPDENFGSNAHFYVARTVPPDANAKIRGLVKFDLNSIPSGATITSASFSIFLGLCTGEAGTNMLHIDRATLPWKESTATWSNSKNIFASIHTENVPCSGVSGYLTYDVVSLVTGWYKGTYPNYGFYLWVDESVTYQWIREFYSRESTSPNKPKLVVTYTVPKQGFSTGNNQTTSPDDTATNVPGQQTTGSQSDQEQIGQKIDKTIVATSSPEKTGMSWARVATLAALALLLIGIVAGYIVYCRRKNKLPKKDNPPSGKPT